ncbi:MAG: iron ABC transporter permease, partial [Desulfobacterales bacterium]|nr:iron ABC transporter permease [Desulfobacterales bacterium]
MLLISLFLLLFLVVPVIQVVFAAFMDAGTGEFTLLNFKDFFSTALFRESFWNSLYVGVMAVLLASAFSLPLAYFTSRFEFKGAVLIQSLGVIPLIMPPFVGAVAMLMLFGRNGSVNLLMEDWFGFNIPFMEGLNGVIFVESLHYFPFILINLSAALKNIDRTMEESAQNLGCSGMRLFRRIVLPLSMPGYMAGASLVFLKVFDDLGTPLLLNVNNMLAPQAYLRIASIGIKDPMGYVISVILVVIALFSLWLAMQALKGKDYATVQKGGGGLAKRRMRPLEKTFSWLIILVIMTLVLAPHLGLAMLSFGSIWSFSVLPDAFTF